MAKVYSRELRDVSEELDRAIKRWPKWTDAHQGIGKILEEFDELKAEVWRKESKRRPKRMRHEALQVAACAIRFALDICRD